MLFDMQQKSIFKGNAQNGRSASNINLKLHTQTKKTCSVFNLKKSSTQL